MVSLASSLLSLLVLVSILRTRGGRGGPCEGSTQTFSYMRGLVTSGWGGGWLRGSGGGGELGGGLGVGPERASLLTSLTASAMFHTGAVT